MIIIDITKGIRVGGFDFKVDVSEDAHRRLVADRDFGQCDLRNVVIEVDIHESAQQISKVFIHEIIEAVDYVYCNSKLSHEKIQQLSFGIHQVMESLGVRFGPLEGQGEKEWITTTKG